MALDLCWHFCQFFLSEKNFLSLQPFWDFRSPSIYSVYQDYMANENSSSIIIHGRVVPNFWLIHIWGFCGAVPLWRREYYGLTRVLQKWQWPFKVRSPKFCKLSVSLVIVCCALSHCAIPAPQLFYFHELRKEENKCRVQFHQWTLGWALRRGVSIRGEEETLGAMKVLIIMTAVMSSWVCTLNYTLITHNMGHINSTSIEL